MEFHQLTDAYTFEKGIPYAFKEKMEPDRFYRLVSAAQIVMGNYQGVNQLQAEHAWHRAKRPYYNLWPSIVPALLKVNLEKVMCDQLSIPHGLQALTVNFAKGHELSIGDAQARSFMIARMELTNPEDHIPKDIDERIEYLKAHPEKLSDGFMILVDTGTIHSEFGGPQFDFIKFRRKEGLTVQEEIADLVANNGFPEAIVKLAVTVMLLEDDPELISPDVLANDRPKFYDAKASAALQQSLADKAKRRGKFGWDIGRILTYPPLGHEISPYYRNAHFSIRWVLPRRLDTNSSIPEKAVENHTGTHPNKRLVPRLTWIKGSMVKREKMLEMPSGYIDT